MSGVVGLGPVTTTLTAAPAIGTTDPREALLRPPAAVAAAGSVTAALAYLPASRRATACVVLVAHDYCVAAVQGFAARCQDGRSRLRATHSVALETCLLLQAVTTKPGPDRWLGRAFVMTSPRRGLHQALRWAGGLVAAGREEHVVVCEVTAAPSAPDYRITALPVLALGGIVETDAAVFDSTVRRHALDGSRTNGEAMPGEEALVAVLDSLTSGAEPAIPWDRA